MRPAQAFFATAIAVFLAVATPVRADVTPVSDPAEHETTVICPKQVGLQLSQTSCIKKDEQCTLHGTPCCEPYECKGSFPNTTCQ